jgi:anti-anti-sigma regulatory factor
MAQEKDDTVDLCQQSNEAESATGGSATSPLCIELGATLDITTVAALYEQLHDALARQVNVTLKAGDVEQADTAALQLLLAFCQDMKGHGSTVTWESRSDGMQRSAELLGLAEELGIA